MKLTRRRTGIVLAVFAAVALSVYGMLPKRLQVETATVTKGPLQVTVEEDGITRVRERFDVTAPVAGRLRRIELHAGDRVTTGQVLLTLEPVPLDAKQQSGLAARLESARRVSSETGALVTSAEAGYTLAKRESARVKALAAQAIASRESVDRAVAAEAQAREAVDAARHRAQAAQFDVEAARAALASGDSCCLPIRSPVAGRVLRVLQESESVVPAGAKIIEIGDPNTIEIAIDLLSDDAVKVHAGDRVIVEGWGGAQPLEARVRRVEPSGFTKVSALGVEEQRVNALADFVRPPPELGDQFRVDTRIVVWEGKVARVPATAIFGTAGGWSAYVIDGRHARLRRLDLGHIGAEAAEVRGGVREGETVVVHPSGDLRDGESVRIRK